MESNPANPRTLLSTSSTFPLSFCLASLNQRERVLTAAITHLGHVKVNELSVCFLGRAYAVGSRAFFCSSIFNTAESTRYFTVVPHEGQSASCTCVPVALSSTGNERRHSVQTATMYPVSRRGIHSGALSHFPGCGRIGDSSISRRIVANSSAGVCGEVVEFECIATAPNWEPGPTRTIILYELPELPPDESSLAQFGYNRLMSFSASKSSDDADFLLAGMGFVANSTDPKVAIAKLVEAAAAALGSDMGSFYLLDRDREVLEPYVTFNFPSEYLAACSSVPLGEQCCGRAAKYKHPWVVEDMWTDPLFAAAREGAKKAGIRAGFSVPVLDFNGDCLGTLAAHFRKPFAPNIYQLERQSAFAKLIGLALVKHGVVQPTKITSQSHRANTSFEPESATG